MMLRSAISFTLLSGALASSASLSTWELPGVDCWTLDGWYEEPPLWTFTNTITETRPCATITETSKPVTNALLTATSTSTITTFVTSTTTETTWELTSTAVPTPDGFLAVNDTTGGWPAQPKRFMQRRKHQPKRLDKTPARREVSDECWDEKEESEECPRRVQCEKVVVVQEIYYTTSQAPLSTKFIPTTAWTKTTTTVTTWETTTETATATATSYDACATNNVMGPNVTDGTIYSYAKMSNNYNLTEVAAEDGTSCCVVCQTTEPCAASVWSQNEGCVLIQPTNATDCPVGSNNAYAGFYNVGQGANINAGDYYMVSNGPCGYLEEDNGPQTVKV